MTKQKAIQTHLDNLKALTEKENVRYEDGTEFNIYDLKELIAKELTAIEEIQEEEHVETALTVDELKKMGDILGDMRETIELYNHALNITRAPRELDRDEFVVQYYALHSLTNTMHGKNQKIMKELDLIGHALSENDNAFEIKDTRKRFN